MKVFCEEHCLIGALQSWLWMCVAARQSARISCLASRVYQAEARTYTKKGMSFNAHMRLLAAALLKCWTLWGTMTSPTYQRTPLDKRPDFTKILCVAGALTSLHTSKGCPPVYVVLRLVLLGLVVNNGSLFLR